MKYDFFKPKTPKILLFFKVLQSMPIVSKMMADPFTVEILCTEKGFLIQ